jgi:hypothetical protein
MPTTDFAAAPPLAEHIASYFGLAVPADVRPGTPQPLPPDGCLCLISQRNAKGDLRASLVGPRTEPLVLPVAPGDRWWGVRFWPDVGGAVLAEDPGRLAGHYVSPLSGPAWAVALARALGECRDAESAARVADELLAGPVAAAAPIDPIVRRAVRALIATHGEMSIADVAAGVGISLRQLERRFGAAVGLNPIQFARVRRMRGDLTPLLGATTWSGIESSLERVRP